MKVLLVGNYEFDGSTQHEDMGEHPAPRIIPTGDRREVDHAKANPRKNKTLVIGLGQVARLLRSVPLFPWSLQVAAGQADVVHICDNGGAIYVSRLKR